MNEHKVDVKTRVARFDATGQRLGADSAPASCTTLNTAVPAAQTLQTTADGGAGSVTTMSTTELSTAKSNTRKFSLSHLKLATIPLIEGQSYTAECGREILNANLGFRWDGKTREEIGLSTLRFCSKCILAALDSGKRRRYVYGIKEAQQAKDEEISEL